MELSEAALRKKQGDESDQVGWWESVLGIKSCGE